MSTFTTKLPPTISQGILNIPGTTAESKAVIERLLEEDRNEHHCFWGKVGLHNHLSHHLLAAYDLAAPPKVLKAIYDRDKQSLDPIYLADRKTKAVEKQHISFNTENWTQHLGEEKYYANYLTFFANELEKLGSGELLENYIFSPQANANGANMLVRLVSGAVHPLIQAGYGVEFGSDAMVAQALAQTACHSATLPELHTTIEPISDNQHPQPKEPTHRQPSTGRSLFSILREVYDSEILHPVMPYDPDALLSKRQRDLASPERLQEIRRLSAQWKVDLSRGQAELDSKVEELLWLGTLLLAGTGKPNRKPRLDFFLMHLLNAALFIPSLLKAIPTPESKARLLQALPPVLINYILLRGRPRIDADLLMSYSATPRPPTAADGPAPSKDSVGDARDPESCNLWPQILGSVIHAPDAHTVKAIRALNYAARTYGRTPAGGAIGAFEVDGKETIKGLAKADGTIFIRAAGVVMDTLGWVDYGQKEGSWDRSALGWDDAWKNGD